MITVKQIVERIGQVDIQGILNVSESENGGYAIVELWRIAGAFRNDRKARIAMIIDPAKDGLENELWFYVPPLKECKPGEMALTIYMDANMKVYHGGHSWDAGEDGDVIFSYAMPVPEGQSEFPDAALFGRLLKDMYEGLLFPEMKGLEMKIGGDDMLSDEEKKEKFEKALQMYHRLCGPKVDDDGAV